MQNRGTGGAWKDAFAYTTIVRRSMWTTLLCLAENQALWVGLVALGPFLTCTLLDVAIW